MSDAEKVIQDCLDRDITTKGTVGFQEFFGERCIAALSSAGFEVVKAAETETELTYTNGEHDGSRDGVEYGSLLDGWMYHPQKPDHAANTHRREVGPWLPVAEETDE
jgi:hypothetical protein